MYYCYSYVSKKLFEHLSNYGIPSHASCVATSVYCMWLRFREKGIIEKIKLEQPALEKMGYRAIVNRENGMTPIKYLWNLWVSRNFG